MRLVDFMAKNIWGPLGMESTTFRPLDQKELMARIAKLFTRGREN
jgi:CubicO group peptidase (beta-lactamase class C family)